MRRIGHEINEMTRKYPSLEIQALFKTDEIHISFSNKQPKFKEVEIRLKRDIYPFIPPQIFIRNKPYIEFIKPTSLRILKLLKTCLCCSTIITKQNWTPTYQICTILNEIEETNELKCAVKYALALEDMQLSKIPKIIERQIMEYLSPSHIIEYLHLRH